MIDITFLFALATTGIVALGCGYAIGLRLTVKALIAWSFIAAVATFAASFGLGGGALAAILMTIVALALLQVGYFFAALTKPEASDEGAGERAQVERARS